MKTKKYDILSPDGFSIHPTKTYTDKNLLDEFSKWLNRYKTQGYYSSSKYGKIDLDDLIDYCEVVELK